MKAIDQPHLSVSPSTIKAQADSRFLPLPSHIVDLIVTSPPYWRKRDYGVSSQIGQESKVEDYVCSLIRSLDECRRVLKSTGSLFLNIGDSYSRRSLVGVPWRIEQAARDTGWYVRNRIIWAKETGVPESARNRLASRHEYILHLTPKQNYYYDIAGYIERFGNWGNPGDVWTIKVTRDKGGHLAPFPEELVERTVFLTCPVAVCSKCGTPIVRQTARSQKLNPDRPQARRAMELAKTLGLTSAHIAAIQATGISDAGKALSYQNGTGRNSARVKELAAEAKALLGGYFREFTFAQLETSGWLKCSCDAPLRPGTLLDPFAGTGTSLRVGRRLGRTSIGFDLSVDHGLARC